jgi:tetratricopeptide (TPR) repeat protein
MKTRALTYLCASVVLVATSCSRDPVVAARSYVETGNKFYKAGKFKQAALMYKKALVKDKKSGEAYYRLGIASMDLGAPLDALRAFQRAVETEQKLPDDERLDAVSRLANLYLGAYIYDSRHPKELLNEMKALGEKNPDTYEGLRILGYVELANSSRKEPKEALEAAIDKFTKANKLKPNQPELVIALVQALSGNNQFDEAEKLARDLIAANKNQSGPYDVLYTEYAKRSRTADAENVLKEKVAANPGNLDFALQLAAHYFATRDRSKVDATLSKIMADFKGKPEMREKVGDFYFRIRDYQLAYDQYEVGTKEQPKRAGELQRHMVETLVALNRRGEAMTLVDGILKKDPADDNAKAMRAALLLQTGSKENINRAVQEMQSLVSRMGDNPVLRFNYGRALLTKGDVDQAAIQFKQAADLRKDYMLPRLALAEIHFNRNQFSDSLHQTEEVLQQEPQNPLAHLIRARAQYMIGDSKKAREELQGLLKANPKMVDAQFQLALLDVGEKNYKDADPVLQRIFRETGDTRALLAYSDSLVLQKRVDEALRILQTELDKNPKRADLRLAMGNVAAGSARLDVAMAAFQKVAEQFPTSGDAYMRLGEVYRMKGDTTNAVANFQKAAQYLPNDVRPNLQLGILADQTGQYNNSKQYYELVLKVTPDNPIALNNLAFRLAEDGNDLDRALGMAERAKQRLPDAPDVSDTLGWIYLKKNLSDNALKVFQEIVKKRPDNPTYRYHLALALNQKGDKQQAKREATDALRANPSKEDETKIKDLLSKL